MADNEYVYDGDVQRITAAELVALLPSQGGRFRLMYRIQFKDGRIQERPATQCFCPEAVGEFERLYYRNKLDAAWSPSRATSPAKSSSNSKSQASRSRTDADDEATPSKAWRDEGDGSEYADDAHLDHISSDDSLWADVVDAEGRPGTNPEARAAIRKEWAAGDETFKTPKTEGSGSSDSDDVSSRTCKASVKSEALSDDSLAQELKAQARGSPAKSPNPRTTRGVGRRSKAVRDLAFGKAARLQTFDEWAFGRKKTASDPNVPSGSGLQAHKKRKAEKENGQNGSHLDKKIKLEVDDGSLPAMPVYPTGPFKNEKKAVEVVDLTLDDDIFTIDSD